MKIFNSVLSLLLLTFQSNSESKQYCNKPSQSNEWNDLIKLIVPELDGKSKGEAGKIAVIGGSVKYTGAPYFAAISALKVGADLAYVITTEDAAPIIKSYSPDLIVVPHNLVNITSIIKSVHVVVIGPGLGREPENLKLAYDAIEICKTLKKPLVIDADGLYAVNKNLTVLLGYPKPGAVLTPNHIETTRLEKAIQESSNRTLFTYWGDYVSILLKGGNDKFYSEGKLDWSLEGGGSGRRAGGQGDILAGALGTFFNWAIQGQYCDDLYPGLQPQSIAAYAAAKLTRMSNSLAFKKYGRSMLASDMINEINIAFDQNFL